MTPFAKTQFAWMKYCDHITGYGVKATYLGAKGPTDVPASRVSYGFVCYGRLVWCVYYYISFCVISLTLCGANGRDQPTIVSFVYV